MNNQLLLSHSEIYKESDLYDNIRQSYINLKNSDYDCNVKDLLNEAICYLDKTIDQDTANEIFSLISLCFMQYPIKLLPIFSQLYEKSKKNINHILATASCLSVLTHIQPPLPLSDYHSFVDEALEKLLPQIQNIAFTSISVYGRNIPNFFKYDFIINLLLSTTLTEDLLLRFLPYICSQTNFTKNPKFSLLVHYIVQSNLTIFISSSILADEDLFLSLSVEDLTSFLPILSDQFFIQIFPLFQKTFSNSSNINATFIKSLLDKCDKLDLKLQKIERVFNFLSSSEIDEHIINQLKKYDLMVPKEFVDKFDDKIVNVSPDTFLYLKEKKIDEIKFCEENFESLKKIFNENKSDELFDHLIFNDNYPPNREKVDFLFDFIQSFPKEKIESFYSPDQNRPLLLKILEKKEIIPPYYLMKIISSKVVFELLQAAENEKENDSDYHKITILQYLYKFSKEIESESNQQLEKIAVLQFKNELNEKLIDFIKKNDFDLISQFDDESLSLVSCALLFADNKAKNVYGLTKENILQFYTISLKNLNGKEFPDSLFTSPDMKSKLQEGCKLLSNNESEILNVSINVILSELISIVKKIKGDFLLTLINTLVEILINNEYRADKKNLFQIIFSYSMTNIDKNKISNGIKVIEHILHSIDILNDFNELKLNLDIFELSEISEFFLRIIQSESSSVDDIFNSIYLIQKFVINPPDLKITNLNKILNVINEKIKLEKWNDLSFVLQFLFNYNFKKELNQILIKQIPLNIKSQFSYLIPIEERTEDDFISLFMKVEDPFNDDSFFEDFFNRIMKTEKSSAFEYLKILISDFTVKYKSTPSDILEICNNEYIKYGDLFIKAIDSRLWFHPNEGAFTRKIEWNILNFSNSRFVNSLLLKLFKLVEENPENYQFFYILKNIACTFPFFFDSKPENVFNSVLPAFDNYSLIFNSEIIDKEKEERRINKIKVSIAALSFLVSALNSTKVLDTFCIWIFKEIEKFSNSQVFCFAQIFDSLTYYTQYPAMTVLQKNINVIMNLMNRRLPNGVFVQKYNNLFYKIISNMYTLINKMKITSALLVDEYKTMKRPFTHFCDNNATLYPYQIILRTIQYPNETLQKFSDELEKEKHFWYKYYLNKPKESVSEDQINNFMLNYKRLIRVPSSIPPTQLNVDLIGCGCEKSFRYAVNQGCFIMKYLYYNFDILLLPQHVQILKKVIEKSNKYYRNSVNLFFVLWKEDYFRPLNDPKIFHMIYEKLDSLPSNDELLPQIYKCFKSLSFIKNFREITIIYFGNIFKSNIQNENDGSLLLASLDKYLPALKEVLSDVDSQQMLLQESFQKNFINLITRPQYRNNKSFLLKISEFLSVFDEGVLPISSSQIIGFMLLFDDENIIRSAIHLCSKYRSSYLSYLGIIQDVYNNEISKENISFPIIIDFLKFAPFVVEKRKLDILNVINVAIAKYSEKYITKQDKEILSDFIFYAFESLVPNRNKKHSFQMSNSNAIEIKSENRKFIFQPIPNIVYDSFPSFWELFSNNRMIITNIIESRENIITECKLFNQYPELFSFNVRLEFFKKSIKRSLLSFFSLFMDDALNIDRNDILKSSFSEFKQKEEEYGINIWFYNFIIKYIGESGIDAGGLRKDWFNKISRALFDPENKLFIEQNKTRNYQPNSCSTNLEYFEFAGKIIASFIYHGLHIEFHLAQPFIKQILHRKVNFNDIVNIDPIKFNSINEILKNDIDNDPINEYYFEVTKEGSDGNEIIELKENGSQIKVTNQNKEEYVQLLTEYYLVGSIKDQVESFKKGFESIISHLNIRIFTSSELDFILCGVPNIDVNDMRQNTQFIQPYNENTPVVKLFFDSISKWEQENLAKLLLFFTGSSIVPIGGFKNEVITIAPGGEKYLLPGAHTCINQLDLPEYETEDELNQKFMLAINQEGFYIE